MAQMSGMESGSSGPFAVSFKIGSSQDVRSCDCALDPCRPVFQVVRKMVSGSLSIVGVSGG